MNRILLQFLILFTNLLLVCNYSFASNWKYLGYANLANGEIFYVFVDIKDSKLSQNIKTIYEKHVFNNPQKLKDSGSYTTIEMERMLNCKEKKISTSKATMFDEKGYASATFVENDKNLFTAILSNDDVNYSIYKEFCLK